MPWDTTELRELTDEASPFATAPRGSTPPETEEDVGGGDAFTMRESPFSAYTPDGNAETEEEDGIGIPLLQLEVLPHHRRGRRRDLRHG